MATHLLSGFPLLPQLDNRLNPNGSCNLTSVAMCLEYLDIPRRKNYGYAQFEDELQHYCESVLKLDRHDPWAMRRVAIDYGAVDLLHVVEGWDKIGKVLTQVIEHLKAGNPCIFHTYLTHGGHIVCCDGVELDGSGKPIRYHLADPFGEFYPEGYDKNYGDDPDLGKYWLSHSTFTRLVLTDGIFWTHLLSKAQ